MKWTTNIGQAGDKKMSYLHAWVRILPLILLAGFASALAGGCMPQPSSIDLSLSKQASANVVNVGATFTYNLSVSNLGGAGGITNANAPATNVELTDTVPSGVTIISATSPQGTCTVSGRTVTCNFAMIDPGDTVDVTLTVQAPQTPGQITNTASVLAMEVDGDPTNNAATVPIDVVAPNQPLSCQASGQTSHNVVGEPVSETVPCTGGTPPYTARETTGEFPGGTGTGECDGATLGVTGSDVVLGGSFTSEGTGTCDADIEVSDSSSPQQFYAFVQHFEKYDLLQIASPFLLDGAVGSSYTDGVLTTGGSAGRAGGGVTIGLVPGSAPLPPGLMFTPDAQDPHRAILTGTPTAGGNYTFTVEARDTLLPSQVLTKSFTINILEITTTTLPDGITGVLYSQVVNSMGSSGAGVTYQVTSGQLPDGLTLAANGAIVGVPTMAGTFSFTVEASEGPRTETQALTIQIYDPLAITTSSLAAGDPNTNYNQAIATSGGSGQVTFSLILGSLPPGMMLDSATGQLTGMPTAGGLFQFTIEARDNVLATQVVTRVYTLEILEVLNVPFVNGTVGQAYSEFVNTTNAVPAATWAIVVNPGQTGLPPGLSLSMPAGGSTSIQESITGTPTQAGTFTFTVHVTNGTASDTEFFTITIDPAPPAIARIYTADGSGDTVSIFDMDETGSLFLKGSALLGGTGTTGVAIGRGTVLAATYSDNKLAFARINADGSLTPFAGSPIALAGFPFDPEFWDSPTGLYLYVPFANSNQVDAYRVDPTAGTVQQVAGAPFATNGSIKDIQVDPIHKTLTVTPTNTTGNTFIVPHVLDVSGSVLAGTASTFDTTVFATYTAGNSGVNAIAGTGTNIDLYLFDQNTGQPMSSARGGAVCDSCTFVITDGELCLAADSQPPGGQRQKLTFQIDHLNGGLTPASSVPYSTQMGYGVIVFAGDAAGVNLQGFVVNTHNSAFDLAVFGFDPVPLASVPAAERDGDGQTQVSSSAQQVPACTMPAVAPKMFATVGGGAVDIAYVVLNPVPAAQAPVVNITNIVNGNMVSFDGTGSMVPGGEIAGTWWDTDDDGSFDTFGSAPQISFATTGTHDVTARVFSNRGLTVDQVTTVVIPATLQTIVVAPNPATTPAGVPLQFTATGFFSDGTNSDITNAVTWSSDNSICTVSNAGVANCNAVGAALITATSGAISDDVTLTVTNAVIQSIEVSPVSVVLPNIAGLTQQFTAIATLTDGNVVDITSSSCNWTFGNPGVGSVDTAGLVTLTGGVGSTTATCDSGGVSDSADLFAEIPSGFDVTPDTANLAFNQTQQFQAGATMSDGSFFDATIHATWTSSNAAIASVSATGLVTSQTTNGPVNITGTLGTLSDTSVVTVTAATTADLAVTTCDDSDDPFYFAVHGPLGDNCGYANLGPDEPGSFTVSVSVMNATLNGITVTPPGACVPDLAAGTCTGTSFPAGTSFSIQYGLGNPTGTVMLTTSILAPGNFDPFAANDSDTETTLANNSTLTAIDIFADPAAPLGSCEDGYDQTENTSVQCRALGSFSDGSNLDLTQDVTWTSSDTGVATVGNTALDKGVVTAVTPGATSITASFGAVNNVVNITVSGAVLTSIDLAPNPPPNLIDGFTQQFTATGNFSDGSQNDITLTATWSTSDLAIASVDANGLVTGQGPGMVNIMATQSGVIGSVPLTVDPAVITNVTVTPNPALVNVGGNLQLTATALFSDSSQQDVTTTATWTSSDDLVATVDSTGSVTGVVAGSVNITATQGGVSGDTFLTVSTPTAANIVVSCTDFSPSVPGIAQQTQCFIFDTGGAPGMGVVVNFTPTSKLNLITADIPGLTCGASSCTGDFIAFDFKVLTLTAEGIDLLGGTTEMVHVDVVLAGEVDTSDNADDCNFDVVALTGLRVTPGGTSIVDGNTIQYTATGTYSDGTQFDISDDVMWTTSDANVATIDGAGLATGVGVGNTTITAALLPFSDAVTLDVLDASTANIAISVNAALTGPVVLAHPQNGTITATGQTFAGQQLLIQASPGAVVQAITVISGNMTCPTPSFTLGNSVLCVLTGDPANPIQFIVLGFANNTAGGTTQTYTYTLTPGGGATADDSVVVPYDVLSGGAQIIMVPSSFKHIVGQPDLQVRAFAGAGGSPTQHFEITEYLNWTTNNSSVATVNNTTNKGLVTGLQPGNATIQAFESHNFALGQSFGTFLGVTGVQVIPGFRQLDLGVNNTFPLRCVQTLSDGSQGPDITQDPSVVWSSSSAAVATVSNAPGTQGLVTSMGAGTADATCDQAGVGSDPARIEVNNTLLPKDYALFADFVLGVDTTVIEPDPSPVDYFYIFDGITVGPLAHSGADAVSVSGHNVVVGFSTSGEVTSYIVDDWNPMMTEVNSLPVTNPGDGAFDPTGACYLSPSADFFTGNGSIENFSLDANHALVSESSTPLPGILPRKLRFNPNQLLGKAYVCDGDNMHVMNWTLTACNVTPAGIMLTFVGRRDFEVDSQGEFLLIITLTPQFTGNFVLQRLGADGNPTGPPITTPLPSPAFQIVAHPSLNVAYALGFFENITPLTYDRATGMVTVGTPIMTPGLNAAAVHPNGKTLFYTAFDGPTCQVPLDAQGIPNGPGTCSGEPRRYHSIDFAPQ